MGIIQETLSQDVTMLRNVAWQSAEREEIGRGIYCLSSTFYYLYFREWLDIMLLYKVLWPSAQGYDSKYDPHGVAFLSHTNGLPWEDEGTTVTFATYFYRLPKAEKTELEVVFS